MGDSGSSRSSDVRRVGDETRKRIDDLADGWSAPRKPPPARTDDAEDGDTERVERPEPDPTEPSAAPPPIPADARSKPASRPPPLPTAAPVRDDSTGDRDDPTEGSSDDATVLQLDAPRPTPAEARHMRARNPVAVPRSRGVLGDMRYVFAALFGVARARAERGEIDQRLAHEREERDRALIAVARHAVGTERYDQPAVERARELLAGIEERRSRHAGAVAGAEEEIAGLERARAAAIEAFEAEDQRLETELQAIATKLAPLEKAAAEVRKRMAALQSTAAALDKRIKSQEKKLVAVAKKQDPGALEAELAAARAERESVLADEPPLAEDLDEIEPKIAGLSGTRADLEREREEARDQERKDAERTAERIKAAEARKQVEHNAVADADIERDRALRALGEQLDVDRPADLPSKLRGVEEHDVEIATLERKHLELGELVEGVNRAALARGIAYWLVALGAVAAVAYVALTLG